MVIVIADKYKNDKSVLKALGTTNTTNVKVIPSTSTNTISKTKSPVYNYPEKPSTLPDFSGVNKVSNPVVIGGIPLDKDILKKQIDTAHQTVARYDTNQNQTIVPSSVVRNTVESLNKYGLDSQGYLNTLPNTNVGGEKEYKSTAPIFIISDGSNGNSPANMGQNITLPSINIGNPFEGLGNIFSGVEGTIDKYVKYALVGGAILLGIVALK